MPDHEQSSRRAQPPDYQFPLKRSMTEPPWMPEVPYGDQILPDRTPRTRSKETGIRSSKAAVTFIDNTADSHLHTFGPVDPSELVDSSSATEHPHDTHFHKTKKRPERRRKSVYLDDEEKEDRMATGSRQPKHLSQHTILKDDQIQELRDEVRRLKKRLEKQDKSYKRLEKNLSDLVQENENLDTQLNDQDTQIRVMQDHQLQRVGTHNFLRIEDDTSVRRKIQSLMSSCTSWAREYAIRRLMLGSPEMESMLSDFSIPAALLSPRYASVAPSIVLNSVLVRNLTDWMFRKPFIGIPQALDFERDSRSNESDIFEEHYRTLLEKRNDYWDLAHSWRSMTLELLDPPESEARSRPDAYDEALEKRKRYYRSSAKLFSRRHGLLYRQQIPDADSKLQEIMRTAGELFATLWRRKIYIECRLEDYLWKPFYAASEELEAHPTEQLMEGDTRKDGHYVQLVIQPAIIVYGDEEGKHYEQAKTLVKAVVWLGDGEIR